MDNQELVVNCVRAMREPGDCELGMLMGLLCTRFTVYLLCMETFGNDSATETFEKFCGTRELTEGFLNWMGVSL